MKRGHFLAVWGWHGSRQGPIPRAGVTRTRAVGAVLHLWPFFLKDPGSHEGG